MTHGEPRAQLARPIQIGALAVIVLSHVFLIATSQDPLRLNVGDPWSEANVLSSLPYVKHYGFLETSFTDILDVGPLTEESYRYTHYPPLSEIFYGAVHKYLGFESIGSLRLFAIGFSALAMWLLFCYVRRLYDSSVALIATMLWSCNLLWMMYADMIHQAPVMQASAFLGLWGLARALDEPRPRYWAAAISGCFACFLTSYDYWLFLPAAVLVTVHLRRGNPFVPKNWGPVLLCAAGCLAAVIVKCLFVIGAVGWTEFLADLHFQFLERSTDTFEQHKNAVVPTLIRRATMVFSPLIWGLVAYLIIRVVWRTTRAQFFTDGTWLALPALAFFVVFSQLAASQMLPMQVALPFYTICSGIVLVRLLRGSTVARAAAIAILVFAPLWSGFWLLRQERSYLDEQGFAQVRAYLDKHDDNDFVMCNLMADGPIQAYLGRHYWPAFASDYFAQYHNATLDLMDHFATDAYHVLLFKDPQSRMIDKSLWPLAMPRRQWSLTGSHLFWPRKAARMVKEADDLILRNLKQVNAEVVLSRPQFDLYKISREQIMRVAYDSVPDLAFVDLGSFTSERNKLLGWSGQRWEKHEMLAGSSLSGHAVCPPWGKHQCRTVLTKRGLTPRGQVLVTRGKLMMRATNACEAELLVRLARPTVVSVAINGMVLDATLTDRTVTARVPRSWLREGVNEIGLSYKPAATIVEAKVRGVPPFVASIELRQACRR